MNPRENGMGELRWLREYRERVAVVLLGALATTLQISAADLRALYEYLSSLQPHAVLPFILQLLGIARYSDRPKPGLPSPVLPEV